MAILEQNIISVQMILDSACPNSETSDREKGILYKILGKQEGLGFLTFHQTQEMLWRREDKERPQKRNGGQFALLSYDVSWGSTRPLTRECHVYSRECGLAPCPGAPIVAQK